MAKLTSPQISYATYDFYQNIFGGAMSETEFIAFSVRSSRELDIATGDKAKTAPQSMTEKLALCCCTVADLLLAEHRSLAASEGGAVASVSNDGYSISFADRKELSEEYRVAMREIVSSYLTQPVNMIERWI